MISVCLAVYNGENYIAEQIASILPQLAVDDELVVSDDSSTDGTVALVRAIGDERIRIVTSSNSRSALLNFAFALGEARGDLIVPVDHDDVWLPGRLMALGQKMSELEASYGPSTPILIHSDLRVVDSELQPIAGSLWRYQKSDPVAGTVLNRLLVQNPVTGCSSMLNAALRDLALPLPQEAVMHDWWLALVAATFGIIAHIDEPTALYRQHGGNDTGARKWRFDSALAKFTSPDADRLVMGRLYRQAAAFLDRYRDRLTSSQAELLEAFATMEQTSAVERRRRILKYRFFYTGLIRNIGRLLLG